MARLTKEAYAAKREFAARRNERNKQISALTEEQHEALANLASARHELHSNQDRAFSGESSIFSDLREAVEALSENNLPYLYLDIDGTITDMDYFERLDLYNELKEDGYAEEATFDDNCIYMQMKKRAFEEYSEINEKIEKYLAEIDKKYSTDYCPTGLSRE